jgi:hypothetical protein
MSAPALNGFTAAATVLKWLRAWHADDMPEAIDLDVVRQMLPTTPYGTGVREIKQPMPLDISGFEGSLVRNPHDAAEWGILYNGRASPERRRFTIAHELGHFILHRNTQSRFNCDKDSVYAGHETLRLIEREADDFASNLLMPGDVLREMIAGHRQSVQGVVRGAVHPLHQVHRRARDPGLLGQRLPQVRVAQQEGDPDAGTGTTHRRPAGGAAWHSRGRCERGPVTRWCRNARVRLVCSRGSAHEAARVQAQLHGP